MKLTAIILFAACLHLSAKTSGQTVTLSVKNVSMREVFREIQKQTGLNVIMNEKILKDVGRVSLNVNNMPVADVLISASAIHLSAMPLSMERSSSRRRRKCKMCQIQVVLQ